MKRILITTCLIVGMLFQGCAGYKIEPRINDQPLPEVKEEENSAWVIITAAILLIYELKN